MIDETGRATKELVRYMAMKYQRGNHIVADKKALCNLAGLRSHTSKHADAAFNSLISEGYIKEMDANHQDVTDRSQQEGYADGELSGNVLVVDGSIVDHPMSAGL